MKSSTKLGFVDLFCGAGGLSWGFVRAGFLPLLAVDSDVPSIRTHELNFSRYGCVSLNRDLNRTRPCEMLRLTDTKRVPLKVLVGGPPCQGWSKVGRGKLRSLTNKPGSILRDPRNRLYKRFILMAKMLRPPCVVMENVPGMLAVENHNFADEIVRDFRRIHYQCMYTVADASWFGVPQERERLIFIGVRDDVDVEIPVARLEKWAGGFRRNLGLAPEVTVGDAIGDLPRIDMGSSEDPVVYPQRSTSSPYLRLMREACDGLLTDHVCRKNEQDVEAFTLMRQGMWYRDLPSRLKRYRDDIFEDKYKRLYLKRRAWTVTAHLEKDCYTHIHPTQPRTISIREAARLQSFPDSFRFYGNWGDRFRQVGNAVPPLMAWGIAEFVKEGLRDAV